MTNGCAWVAGRNLCPNKATLFLTGKKINGLERWTVETSVCEMHRSAAVNEMQRSGVTNVKVENLK